VACNRWQDLTQLELSRDVLGELSHHCAEFLVHGVDVEGMQQGIDPLLVDRLAAWAPVPTTYAGGIRSAADIDLIDRLGRGRIDFTVGSALDLFGGTLLAYADLVRRYAG
jgi:phosphoribosylformimino-5-aminoimidazole carboxamide ribotide isomerase